MIDFFFNQFRINTVTPSGTNVSYLTKATCHLQPSDDDEQPQPDDTLVAAAWRQKLRQKLLLFYFL